MTTLFEVCCTTIESAQSAIAQGAHRVELCSYLEHGGLTPTWLTQLRDDPTLRENLQPQPHPMGQKTDFLNPTNLQNKSFLDSSHVLIRCRPGDFVYTQAEVDEMCESIRICRQARVKGVVIGALTREGHLDVPAIKQMIHAATAGGDFTTENGNSATESSGSTTADGYSEAAISNSATESSGSITADGYSEAAKSDPEITEGAFESAAGANARLLPPLTLVFHRAFDVCANPQQLLEQIIELGFHTLLTSGQGITAEEGIPLLAQLVKQAQGKIQIMAGRGVTLQNVAHIIRETKVPAVHMSERPGLDEIAGAIADVRF